MNSFYNYAGKVNELIRKNRNVKTQEGRVAVIKRHNVFLNKLKKVASNIDHDSNGIRVNDNRYLSLIIQINDWILSGTSKAEKKYFANSRYMPHDQPSEIKDTIANNAAIYKNNGNKFKRAAGALVPTKAELRNGQIKSLYEGINELKHKKHGNWFKVSKAIKQMKEDLNLALVNTRGLDEFKGVDNMVTPKQSVTTPSFDSEDYIKFLLKTSLNEISDENVRTDKLDVEDALKVLHGKTNVLIDLERGYSEAEAAERHDRSSSSVSRELNRITKHLLKYFN